MSAEETRPGAGSPAGASPAGARAEGPSRHWRRKWRRADPARRREAAAALRDVFEVRKRYGLLWLVVGLSVVVHAAPAILAEGGGEVAMLEASSRRGYLRKVLQTERARRVSRQVRDRITMPVAPPEPEAVVERAMTQSLAADVAKVTDGLLSLQLQAEVASYVKTNLRNELAAAARDIATGRLSRDAIEQLHRKFQQRAHQMTVAWRQDYLKTHQVERAAMSTTEWYESDVSRTLVNNMFYELFQHRHREAWPKVFVRTMARGNNRDVFIVSGRDLGNRLGLLGSVPAGKRFHNDQPDASWPGPNADQARWLLTRLKELCDGTNNSYPHNYAPRTSLARLIEGFAWTYCPHRQEETKGVLEKVSAARGAALGAARRYLERARGAPEAASVLAARDDCLKAVKDLTAAASAVRKLALSHRKYAHHEINRAVKTELFRGPLCRKAYRRWVDELVEGLRPLVRDFARGQFKKGIIVHKEGVDRAMKDFPRTVIPLLRRDMRRLIPEGRFREICFMPYQHRSKVTDQRAPPGDEDAGRDRELLARACAEVPEIKAYVAKRREILADQLLKALDALAEEILTRVLTGNLLFRNMAVFVEGVDYADRVQEKLNARAMALQGRGQDLAKLTTSGVPDTSAPLVALMFGASKGHGASLEPVATSLRPAGLTSPDQPRGMLQGDRPVLCGRAAKWGFETQAEVRCKFDTRRFEAIPFLTKFPSLDGDLGDWGRIRPLILRPRRGGEPIMVYAAWNYQGFFFGFEVAQDAERFYFPSLWRMAHNHNTGGVWYRKVRGVHWAYKGDYFRVLLDTLDARNDRRGEPHTQEFVVFPRGIESDPNVPGIERVIASQRDAARKQYRGVKSSCEIFPPQPPADSGPDGSGPYRATRVTGRGYAMEVFIPRTKLKVPVFAPGWYIGFDCVVATGVQPPHNNDLRRFNGQAWVAGQGDTPERWGDLLLLGTDPRIYLQEANALGNVVYTLTPGQSYLLTVIDPDRNVSPAAADAVLVSAEVGAAAGVSPAGGVPLGGARHKDVEVYVLKESGRNTGVFRGYVNTQPGPGREVQGVLEIMPLEEVRLGYVDFANSRGTRNVVSEMRLPVIAPMTTLLAER